MNGQCLVILCGVAILAVLLVPAAGAVDPLWTETATTSGELSCLVISADGSTIVAGGDQLIALSRDGRKLWTGWSGSRLAISHDGKYLVTSRDTTVRMISGTGTMLWDESLTVPVAELAMLPDASLIAAAGGTRVRIINTTGSGFRQNTSITAKHIRFFQKGDRLVITTKTGVQSSNLTLFSEWADTNVSQEFVEVAGDGSSFVTVTNNRVRQYSRDGSLQWERAVPGGNALSFAYSRDGSTIIVGRDDNTIEVLDGNGTQLWTGRAPYWVTSVAVSDDGNTIAAGSLDKTLLVYDREGTLLGSSTTKNPIKAGSVVVSGDGSVIAAVDASTVYGFSRSQFTGPATPPATPGAPLVPLITTTAIPTTTPVQMVPSGTVTPRSPLCPAISVTAFGLLLLCRPKKT
jgi:WD40 repeat protein